MVILRCTQKLRRRLPDKSTPSQLVSTTSLGDWTCHLVRFGRIQLILCVSHVTLLPILVPARQAVTFPVRLPTVAAQLLTELAVPPSRIEREVEQMATHSIAPTNNRQVLGSLNDFKRMAEYYVESADPDHLLAVSRHLADVPCKPIDYMSPRKAVTAALIGSA